MNVSPHEPDSPHKEGDQTSLQLHQHSDCSRLASDDLCFGNLTGNIKHRNSRRDFRWSEAARDLVRANINAVGIEASVFISAGLPNGSLGFVYRVSALWL